MTPIQQLIGYLVIGGWVCYAINQWIENGWKHGVMVLSPIILYYIAKLLVHVS